MKLIDPTTQENIRIAINSIKSHLLRTVLTVSIIAFGIMALVGIMTSISAIEYFLVENFTRMGSNTFTIKYQSMRMGGERHQANMNKVISCAYQNTHDVFFYVFDTYKVDSVFVANLVEEQLIKNKFNLEVVKELILSEDIVVTESLKKYEMIDRVLMMKKFQSKEVNSSNDEVVKI